MYDGAFPDRGVMSSFSGHVVGSFYIKVCDQPQVGIAEIFIYQYSFTFDVLMDL